jgi:hypothetical protein
MGHRVHKSGSIVQNTSENAKAQVAAMIHADKGCCRRALIKAKTRRAINAGAYCPDP